MKLIKAHIENFGKISSQDFDFLSGLTTFCQNNGYGKTTLATFIKVMFYGMATTKGSASEKGKDLKDREHYYPFSGGKYGGYLVYEKDGKTYKIVRYFDKKSETLDDVKLYENDNLIPTPECLGKTLFEVDEASFSKLLFFNETFDMNFSSPDITFKLTGLVHGTSDDEYQKVKKNIDEARKKLKVNGGKGEIQELKNQLVSLNADIENLKSIDYSLTDKYRVRNELLQKLEEAEKKLQKVSEIKIKNDNYKTYQTYIEESKKLLEDVETIKSKYPNGLFNEDEISILYSNIDQTQSLEQERQHSKVSEEKLSEFNNLNGLFASGVPTDKDVDCLIEDIKTVNAYKLVNPPKKVYNALFIISAILLALGGGLVAFNTFIGISLICLAVIGGALGGLNLKAIKKPFVDKESLNKKIKIESFLAKYNVNAYNYLEGAYELKNKIRLYNDLVKEISLVDAKLKSIIEKYNECSLIIKNLFAKYNIIPTNLGSIKAQIRGIETDIIGLKNKEALYKQSVLKAENYKTEKEIISAPIFDVSYEEVEQVVKGIQNSISNVDREIKNDEDKLESLDYKLTRLDELKQLLDAKTKRYNLLIKVASFLEMAEKSLNDKYINPIRDRFIYYIDKLEKVLGDKITIKNDFQILFERGGEFKSHEFLSTGQLILCNLCLRLSLIDNMFKDKKPFVILDDYFVCLDKEHMEKAKNLLKELETDRQIIYFTCHDSRVI